MARLRQHQQVQAPVAPAAHPVLRLRHIECYAYGASGATQTPPAWRTYVVVGADKRHAPAIWRRRLPCSWTIRVVARLWSPETEWINKHTQFILLRSLTLC
eukprot:351971-Chlamydomonas_euryale.AAC.5